MPSYTAHVGHWSDQLFGEVAAKLAAKHGADLDGETLRAVLRQAGAEMDLVTGHMFGTAERRTESLDPGGMPFIDVPDLQVGSHQSQREVWPVPDPVNPQIATVLQLAKFEAAPERAIATGEALRAAGELVSLVRRSGRLSRDYLRWLLAKSFDHDQRLEFLKRVFDPGNRINLPIAAAVHGGWWFQITRRMLWVANQTLDEKRLVEPLLDVEGPLRRLVVVEPILIAARLTKQPVDIAIAVRVWPVPPRSRPRPWRFLADAVHHHGIPILTIDEASTPEEVGCQLLLLGYWHRYVTKGDLGIADAIAAAYPKAVERVKRGTQAPDLRSAAALLLEGLLHPGFDPTLGAQSSRRYVNRKATIAILEHRKAEATGLRVWESLGVSERYYYKLLKRFAKRAGKTYVVDNAVLETISKYLGRKSESVDRRSVAMEVLQQRGFSWGAARKWLQRHDIEGALKAQPRARRSGLRTQPNERSGLLTPR